MEQLAKQMFENMVKNLIMSEATEEKNKLIHAKSAAHESWDWASAWGGPIAGAIAAGILRGSHGLRAGRRDTRSRPGADHCARR
jgi:hypothetical protein